MKPKFYWHIHHEILMESATEPIKNRVNYIKKYKPEHEVETRLRLLKPVRGKLPKAVVKAWKEYIKVSKTNKKSYERSRRAASKSYLIRDKKWRKYSKGFRVVVIARDAYYKALRENKDEIGALHKKECQNCPWNGYTIFPNGGGKGTIIGASF